ncbi:IS1595 family transposase [Pseudolysobacter antarcticus]|uniref:IS1595 family transposase n=1 Tax=Pseudolysobacter antarcticus TaxID=2511995 RepID=A0A411HH06_9GAMM|nr:IS1595 family transposase [Pseudolysobacter antarcticus]
MAMNKIQFQPGMSMTQFEKRYGNEAACAAALESTRWPNGFVCPRCQNAAATRFERGHQTLWECRRCGHQASLVAGTVLENTKLPLRTWFRAMYLLTQSKNAIAALELMRHLGVSYSAAWRIKHKLMQAMNSREAQRQLGGIVELDDAHLGGERNGGKSGRGAENKRPFLLAVATDERGHPRHAVATAVKGFTSAAVHAWAQAHLVPGTDVFSDGLGCFTVLSDSHAHTVVRAGPGRAAAMHPRMRWVNTVLGNVKRSLDGTCHAIKHAKYAQRYLAEAMWRFNRRFDLAGMLAALLNDSVHEGYSSERRLREEAIYVC